MDGSKDMNRMIIISKDMAGKQRKEMHKSEVIKDIYRQKVERKDISRKEKGSK